jgi:hypothetical protein
MLKKSFAAALLVAMMAWAEMAMAPMFVMQLWHTHAGREMSANMAARHRVMAASHPCCPGISKPGVGKTEEVAILDFGATSPPCGDEHRCCFRQGPLNVPAPVGARTKLSQNATPAEIAALDLARDAEPHFSSPTAIALGPPPNLLGMVRRI